MTTNRKGVEMTRKITEAKATKALEAVAAWLGKTKRWGPWVCDEGRELDGAARHADDKTDCATGHYGPCPIGPDAASHGLGPQLVMDWDWPGEPTPTILLEGGPYDWAIEAAWLPELKALGVFAEPYAGYALCLYPAD